LAGKVLRKQLECQHIRRVIWASCKDVRTDYEKAVARKTGPSVRKLRKEQKAAE
jgi:hypothetical protein